MKRVSVLATSCLVSLPLMGFSLKHKVIPLSTEVLVTASGVQITLKPILRVFKDAVQYSASYTLESSDVPADRIATDIQDLFTRKQDEMSGHGATHANLTAFFVDASGTHLIFSCNFTKAEQWAPRCRDERPSIVH